MNAAAMLALSGMALGSVVFLAWRYLPLALAVACAPLPGAFFAWMAHNPPLPVYGFGAGVAALAAAGVLRARVSDGAPDWTPILLAACGGILLMLLRSWILGVAFAVAGLCGLAAAAALRAAPLDEDAIARANRLQERCAFAMDNWSRVMEPRWGWALSGVGLVLAVLAGFRHGLHMSSADATGLAVLLLALLGTARDWRAALAAGLAGLLLLMFGLALPQYGFLVLPLGLRMAASGQGPVGPGLAFERAGGLGLAGLAGLAAFSWVALGAFVAGLALFPALTTVLREMFTPRRSVEQLYRN